jgi:hypothetical protein
MINEIAVSKVKRANASNDASKQLTCLVYFHLNSMSNGKILFSLITLKSLKF